MVIVVFPNWRQLLYIRTGSDIFFVVSLMYFYPKELQRNEWYVKHPFS